MGDCTTLFVVHLGLQRALRSVVPDCSYADAGTSSPTLLTTVPANAVMANVTAFVDATNIAQYTSSQVSHDAPPSAHGLLRLRTPWDCGLRHSLSSQSALL